MPGLLQDDLNFRIDTADMTQALGALGAAIKGLNLLNENHSKFSLSGGYTVPVGTYLSRTGGCGVARHVKSATAITK